MTRTTRFLPVVASLTWLSGCALGHAPMVTAQPAAPAAWTSSASGTSPSTRADLTRWWDTLHDATLTALVDRALAANPDVHVAEARLRQARALQAQADAALWPTLNASASASGRRSGQRAVGLDGRTSVVNVTSGSYGGSLDASWEPDIFGAARQGRTAATADLGATAADLAAVRVSLAAEVATTYLDLRTLQARLDIATKNATSQQDTLTLTSFRNQAGLVGALDVEQARANLAQTQASIPPLQAAIAQAMFRLATLAGAEPGALVTTLTAAAALPDVPDAIATGIPAETLRQRPDVRAAALRAEADRARLAQVDAQRFPSLALSGSIGAEVLKGAGSAGTSIATSLAATLVRTLFDHGRTRSRIDAQAAVQAQTVAAYEGAVLTALEDVERALVAFESSRARLEALETALTAAGNAATLARTQYASGLTDFQTVLNTERTVLTVQESVAVTRGDRVAALIQLYKALGGGWSPATTTEASQS